MLDLEPQDLPSPQERNAIREPETNVGMVQPQVEMQRTGLDDDLRVAIVGAGGYGRVALDVLISGGSEEWIMGFYDDAHATLSNNLRGFPILGDIGMLKSMLSVEPVHVVVAITDNAARLRVANALRALGGKFATAVHPMSYLSDEASVGDGCVVAAGVVVQPDAAVGSHCSLGAGSVVERDAVVGAGAWLSAGAVVGVGARVGARSVLGYNASVGRKAAVEADVSVGASKHVGVDVTD
jgi:sugar O-acyltransferase (sialic acid O-acetyltransferase NeuD family)